MPLFLNIIFGAVFVGVFLYCGYNIYIVIYNALAQYKDSRDD